jgi:hypothetical protein
MSVTSQCTSNSGDGSSNSTISPNMPVMEMSRCFRAVCDVYLGHTLSAMLDLYGRLVAQNDDSKDVQCCVSACETVLRYVRSAQRACGVLGLLAIDRSQEHLQTCLKTLSATTAISGRLGRTMYSVAGLCYANALNRQCQGDTHLKELWIFAADCADAVLQLRPNQTFLMQATSNQYDPHIAVEAWEAFGRKALKFDRDQKSASQTGKAWTCSFMARSAQLSRLVVVYAQICDIYQSEQRILPSIDRALYRLMKHQVFSAQAAVTWIERNMDICRIADSSHSVAVKGLADVAAQRLLTAVELVVAKPATPLDNQSGHHSYLLQQRERRAAPLERNATALANLASALTAVTMQIAEARATAAVPEQLLASAAQQVHDVTAEIEATADDDGDDAVHVRDFARLKAEIDQIGDKLKAAQASAASPEELAIQRFLTEAGKVRREASPAHPHMAECWLQAASHMRLAVDARAAATTAVDAQRVDKHRACCRIYEKLAAGIFRDAASYFAKAARTASPYAHELWREAADLLLQMGVASMQRMDQVATGTGTFSSATLAAPTPLETAQSRCVAACAICAKALDGVPKADAAAIVAALRADTRASATVDAANVGVSAEGENYAVSNLKMLLLIVHVERTDLAQAAAVFPTAGAAGAAVLNLLRAVVDGTLLLSRACQLTVSSYPVGHVLYRTAPSADAVQQRDQLLRWLCDAAVDNYKHLHRVFEAQLILNRHEKAIDAILHSVRVAEGVLWFVFPTASGQPAYPVHSYQQAQVYQVLSQRYLAASSRQTAGLHASDEGDAASASATECSTSGSRSQQRTGAQSLGGTAGSAWSASCRPAAPAGS